jgi:hypothetical protein
MKATLDLVQTGNICLVGVAVIYVMVLIRRAIRRAASGG